VLTQPFAHLAYPSPQFDSPLKTTNAEIVAVGEGQLGGIEIKNEGNQPITVEQFWCV
jgi:hypothetical protein